MCHSRDKTKSHLQIHISIEHECVRKARRVVKKYRKMSLKKEMQRLRQMLPNGEKLKQTEVLEETILLIQQLEKKLLRKIQETGIPTQLQPVIKQRH